MICIKSWQWQGDGSAVANGNGNEYVPAISTVYILYFIIRMKDCHIMPVFLVFSFMIYYL